MSTLEPKRPKPLSEPELRKLIADAIENGAYIESFHARFDHVERKISLDDVLHGLEQRWSLIDAA
jgi:hypothetical protein